VYFVVVVFGYFLNMLRFTLKEVTGNCGKVSNEELKDLYFLPNIIWVSKTRRMRWQGMWHMWGRRENSYRVLVGKWRKETTWNA